MLFIYESTSVNRSTQGFQMLIFGPVAQKLDAIFLMIFPTQPSYLGTNTAQDHFTMILGIVVLCPAGLFENWRITGSNPVECWDFFSFLSDHPSYVKWSDPS